MRTSDAAWVSNAIWYLVALGFQVSGWVDPYAATALWTIAGLMSLWLLLGTTPIAKYVVVRREKRLMSSLIAASVGALVFGVGWWLLQAHLSRAAPPSPSSAVSGTATLKEGLTALRIPGPGSPNARLVALTTEGNPRRSVSLRIRPTKILVEPSNAIVDEQELPKEVDLGAAKIIIRRFTEDGLVIDERQSVGVSLRIIVLEGKPLPTTAKAQAVSHTQRIAAALEELVAKSAAIERDIRGDSEALRNLAQYQKRIESLRAELGAFLNRELPRSGAVSLALPKEGVTGQGPLNFEYSRLRKSIDGQREILRNLETYIERSQGTRLFPRHLIDLRERAVNGLLNRSITNEADLHKLQQDITSWEEAVSEELNGIATEIEISRFRVLGTYSPKRLGGWSPDHSKTRDILAEKLDRLDATISRIQGVASR